mgnify:FL=1|jgi:hypothetical protein|tara:strand:- start:44 stop:619 length:576 start_codon:yes stop_codon:yes gene_type:complete
MSTPTGLVNIRKDVNDAAIASDVRRLSARAGAEVTVTTATIAVTDDTNTDVSFTQPAGTIIRNLIAIPAGNIVTGGTSGNDVDFSLGTAAGGGQIIATEAILDDGGSAVTWAAKAPLYLIKDSHGHGANAFVTTSVTAGVVGGPATSEAIVIASTLYSAADRTLHARLTPIGADLATAATTVKYVVQFQAL